MSLVEIMIAIAIVSLTFLAMMSLVNSSGQIHSDASHRTIAHNAARQVLEEMRGTNFHEILSQYNSAGAKNTFYVTGLPPGPWTGTWTNPITGTVEPRTDVQGKVFLPENSTGRIDEDPSGSTEMIMLAKELGLPKDLNRNNTTNDTGLYAVADGSLADALKILPVKVEVRWRSAGGQYSNVKIMTYIRER